MNEFVKDYEIVSTWKTCSQGERVAAKKGGKMYVLKKYEIVEPVMNGAFDEKTFEKNKEAFIKFKNYRTKINQRLREIAKPGGNIIVPAEEFVHNHKFIEATEFIPGALDSEEIEGGFISTLSKKAQDTILKTMIAALEEVHSKGVVHSDLKVPNVLIIELTKSENYVAKLIDFDSSFFIDDKSQTIGYTEQYMSPEQAILDLSEGEEIDEAKKYINEKTDIFSMGVIFHMLLSGGEMPEAESLSPRLQKMKEKGQTFYVSTVLLQKCKLKISDKIKSDVHKRLIYDMLEADSKKRPSASEVLARLKGENDGDVLLDEPWAEDKIILVKEKFVSLGYMGLTKVVDGDKKRYDVRGKDGRRVPVDAAWLISNGLAKKRVEEIFEEPWPEHPLVYNLEKLKLRKYIAVHRATVQGVNGYRMYRADGEGTFVRAESLLMMGYANKKSSSTIIDTPKKPTEIKMEPAWPEHKIVFVEERLKQRNYTAVKRAEVSGVKGYHLYRGMDKSFFRLESMIMVGYAKPI